MVYFWFVDCLLRFGMNEVYFLFVFENIIIIYFILFFVLEFIGLFTKVNSNLEWGLGKDGRICNVF